MDNKEVIIIAMCFILTLLFTNFALADLIVSDAGVQYDSSIVERFDSGSEEVRILVGIKDLSGIVVEGTKEERDALINQKEEWYESKVSEILSDLDGEIDLIASSVTGIQGYVSREGFEIVINNSYVSSVVDMTNAPSVGTLEGNETNQTSENVSEIPNEEKNSLSLLFWIIGGVLLAILVLAIIINRGKSQ